MNNKNTRYIDYREWLFEELQDPEQAVAYLNEALVDEDPQVFLIALQDVLKAQESNITTVAKKSQMSRQNLYRMLSKNGNPQWKNLTSLFNTMGMQVHLSIKK